MNDTLVIDLETKKSFAEVGGERNIDQLGISVAGVYSYDKDSFVALEEHELPQLEDMLHKTGHVIGFNINHFDIPVLKPYVKNLGVFEKIAVTDLYEDAVNFLGHRVGLNAVSEATLGQSKSGHGLEALEWFRQGRVEEVKKYCLDDVRLTRDVYEYGKKHGHILFRSFADNKIHSVPVEWAKGYAKPSRVLLEEALVNRKRLAIEYVSSEDHDGLGFKKARLIDVYAIKGDEVEAYCHLRKSVRMFRISRILKIEPTGESYIMAQDAQAALF
ncbi:MAG: WYL domain-containing protein [Candidatus Sungbacteria bacterium]|nr:WYL domain-containing protein [Candidatus Sungbacteria bacterium]